MSADDDKLLDRYLAGDSELSRRYRGAAGDESPPAGIDDHLRAAARREVRSGPRRFAILSSAWTRPLAAAAVIVLAVGVVLQISRDDDMVHVKETGATLDSATRQTADEPESVPQPGAETPRALEFESDHVPATRESPAQPPPQAPVQSPVQAPARERSQSALPDATRSEPSRATDLDDAPDPETWLNQVRRLVARGEMEAARQRLERFTERYPAYPVPQDLRELSGHVDSSAGEN